MKRSVVAVALALMASLSTSAHAQETSDKLRIAGDVASSWVEGDKKVLLIEGAVSIVTDEATLSADRAVVWLSNVPESGNYTIEIALAGNAKVSRGQMSREGGELFVTAAVRPDVQLEVTQLNAIDKSTDVHYLAAAQLRRQAARGDVERPVTPIIPIDPSTATTQPTTEPTTGPTTRGARRDRKGEPVTFKADQASMAMTPEGKVALTVSGNLFIIQTKANGDRIELQAERAVLFTTFDNAKELFRGSAFKEFDSQRDLDAVYLEGDVRMDVTPGDARKGSQSLRASRIVYEFATDRAILTDALLHSRSPTGDAPIVVRARAMRKLGTDEYEADHATITTSEFATPSLSLSSTKVTVRQGVAHGGTNFVADNVTPRLYGVPFFYFPKLWGSATDGIGGLRAIQISNSNRFGFGLATQWGLFETFGIEKPENFDAAYRLDYYTERGPAGGLDANYSGGGVNENTLQPWGFQGNFSAYGAYDHGQDILGKRRLRIPHDDELRGRILWNHQQFLPDNWQVQARLGYVSDGTFNEQWFRNDFRNGLPIETSLYVKRSEGAEVLTAGFVYDLSGVPSIADQLQEYHTIDAPGGDRYPIFVEKLPEVTYQRLGESFDDDKATWVSNNSASVLHFNESRDGLTADLGFRNINDERGFPGIASYGYTGYTDDYILRGDTRQEIDYPMGDDRVRITPYGVVRYTAYSDSPGGGAGDRLLGGVGVRTSTQFSKVYDNAESKLFDVHRMRHIVEPQINLFASAATIDREDVYVYDEGVDGISDVEAAQFVIKQRFQTKRGGEGRWRSVDFLTVNTGVSLFANEPDEVDAIGGGATFEDAGSFRGEYFASLPEASLARSTAFADATWRVTDTTAILGDTAWNLEDQNLATAAVGMAVQRDPRVRYFLGVRYIGEINETLGTVTFDYDISTRYSLSLHENIDLSSGTPQNTSAEINRKFEQYVIGVSLYFDRLEDEGGIAFTISPRNLPFGGPQLNGRGSRR